ncbi:lon-related putative ATP-dependent protease [Modicisalibacter ilicicola DSM 19980]|uniref:endopeptidase La n=1 Tax=Modicisalibacter ilicicola DSM 19980 TaxID=1121942 RepID=A0A1M4SI92_9GAMM|nr:ATP-binding protein [Halomonas ilicicola]SHE31868.1 lon-related putative ATP-dependent protease [Halomonas ilicicola DSM 19980]
MTGHPEPLAVDRLYRHCDPDSLDFETSDELEPLDQLIGQERALEALRFGTGIQGQGYNLFVLGPSGAGKHEIVQRFLHERSRQAPTPSDWCYLHDFKQGSHPRLIELPAGKGARFRRDLEQLVDELQHAIPATFESDEYQSRLHEIQQELGQRQSEAFREIGKEAEQDHIALIQSPNGFSFAPRNDEGEVMDVEAFQALPEERRQAIQRTIATLQEKLQRTIQQMPRWRKEVQQRIRELNEEMATASVGPLIEELRETYRDHPRVVEHVNAIQQDVTESINALISQEARSNGSMASVFSRYQANLLVDNAEQEGAPVVYEDMPTYQHLVGRVEHQVHQGALLTDFRLIRAGALHRANGGYLILDVAKVLTQPFVWESLKRALYGARVKIESLERLYSLASTVSLEPEPMPLDLKVVLIGNRMLYYLLCAHDPDFLELFKVQADLEEDVQRDTSTQRLYARLFATLAREANLKALGRDAVARLIEHASRLADDSERLSIHRRAFSDLLREADYWAAQAGSDRVTAEHVQEAIDQQVYRASRVHESMERSILRDIMLIDTAGEALGQVNGLSVIQLGGHAFGRPTRITATARPGRGGLVDIEREAKLGGNIHSKGVMILSRLLASRYAGESALSLSASLAFEQSYGMVDGDSASVAEFCALLSVLARTPLRQSLAVTGSVNQHGQVQAVGGVNEKIEGFFDICQARGLDGSHGVLLPGANVVHLMLRRDVVEAVRAERFHVYPIDSVDEAIGLLTGVAAGERDADGCFPVDTLNRRVADRLREFTDIGRQQSDGDNRRDGKSP